MIFFDFGIFHFFPRKCGHCHKLLVSQLLDQIEGREWRRRKTGSQKIFYRSFWHPTKSGYIFSLIPLLPPPLISGAMGFTSLGPTANQTARVKSPTQTGSTDWPQTTSRFLQSLTVTPGYSSTAQQCNPVLIKDATVTRATNYVFKICFTFHSSGLSADEYVSRALINGSLHQTLA